MTSESTPRSRWPRADLAVSVVALAVATAAALGMRTVPWNGSISQIALGYVAFWAPFVAAALLVRARGWNGRAGIAWRITWLDVLLGLGAGLLLRVVAGVFEILLRGEIAMPRLLLATPPSVLEVMALALTVIVAPVVISPLIEELFFRGTLLGALRVEGARHWMSGVAIVVSSLLFALSHALTAATPSDGVVAVVASLVLGLGAGALAVVTGRIGASVMAHAAFNGALVAATLL